jgi:hypothetical protein
VPRLAGAAAVVAVLAGAAPAAAQVNAETLRASPFASGWHGSLDLSLALLRGNVDLFDIGVQGRVQNQSLFPAAEGEAPFVRQRLALVGSLRFADRSGAAIVNQSFLHLRLTRMWRPPIGGDVFLQSQQNEFQRLERRRVAGMGLRTELVRRRGLQVAAGAGAMLEHERVSPPPGGFEPAEATTVGRATAYLTARLDPMAGELLIQATGYFQPRFSDVADHRLLGEIELQVRAGSRLSLSLVLTATRDSRPPAGVLPTDVRFGNTLRMSF